MTTDDDNSGIPWEDLAEVLRSWSGRGQLYEALAAIPDDLTSLRWSQEDVARRANRVVFEEIRPYMESWPTTSSAWLDALPAQSHRTRRIHSSPTGSVDWVGTRTLGWPPERFLVREQSKSADLMMTRVLRWVLDSLAIAGRDADNLDRKVVDPVRAQLDAALQLLDVEPVITTEGLEPRHPDIASLRASGQPWNMLATVADHLSDALSLNLLETARRHIAPVDELRWRLFHLAVFGGVVKTMKNCNMQLLNCRPLSGSNDKGPNYIASKGDTKWDLWFESSSMWKYYKWESPYKELITRAGTQKPAALGADITLVAPGKKCIVIECKYGDRSYVFRNGYHQTLSYALEVSSQENMPTCGFVVGTDSAIPVAAQVKVDSIPIIATGPSQLESRLAEKIRL